MKLTLMQQYLLAGAILAVLVAASTVSEFVPLEEVPAGEIYLPAMQCAAFTAKVIDTYVKPQGGLANVYVKYLQGKSGSNYPAYEIYDSASFIVSFDRWKTSTVTINEITRTAQNTYSFRLDAIPTDGIINTATLQTVDGTLNVPLVGDVLKNMQSMITSRYSTTIIAPLSLSFTYSQTKELLGTSFNGQPLKIVVDYRRPNSQLDSELSAKLSAVKPLITTSKDSYCYYFVDLEPNAMFTHPVKHVLFNTRGGSMKVFDGQMWPIIYKFELVGSNIAVTGGTYYGDEKDKVWDLLKNGLSQMPTGQVTSLPSAESPTSIMPNVPSASESIGSLLTTGLAPGDNASPFYYYTPKCWTGGRKILIIIPGNPNGAVLNSSLIKSLDQLKTWWAAYFRGFEPKYEIYDTGSKGLSNVYDEVQNLSKNLKGTLRCNDEVFIYVSMHGSNQYLKWVGAIDPPGKDATLLSYRLSRAIYNAHPSQYTEKPMEDALRKAVKLSRNAIFTQDDLNNLILDLTGSCHINVALESCYGGAVLNGPVSPTRMPTGARNLFTSALSYRPCTAAIESASEKANGMLFISVLIDEMDKGGIKTLDKITAENLRESVRTYAFNWAKALLLYSLPEDTADDRANQYVKDWIDSGTLSPLVSHASPCECHCCGQNWITNAYTRDKQETCEKENVPANTVCDYSTCEIVAYESPFTIPGTPVGGVIV